MAKKLESRIAEGGAISVHDYMDACLYDHEHGYYRARQAIGQGGDFITAPEISQVFGELIGLWAGEVWRQMGEPAPVRLIELGPGRGVLMADALRAVKVAPGFMDSATVHLIESSRTMRDAQRDALASAPLPVSWHEQLAEVPGGPGIVIANEFLDCLPVRQFVYDAAAGGWRERMVEGEGGAFRFAAGAVMKDPPAPDVEMENGAIFEHRPAVDGVVAAFSARAPFAALIIDYGYAGPSFGDTIQAVRAHRFVDLFDAPGESDITAHVDFSHLKEAAAGAKMKSFGPMPMGEWLLRLGLEARLGRLLRGASEEEAIEMRSGAARLVDPAQMGALFKVLALTHGVEMAPPPF